MVNLNEAEALLRREIDGRLEALQEFQRAQQEQERARQALDDATTAVVTAWASVEAAGWTAAQLKQLGVARPSSERPRKPRRPRRSRNEDATTSRATGGEPVAERGGEMSPDHGVYE